MSQRRPWSDTGDGERLPAAGAVADGGARPVLVRVSPGLCEGGGGGGGECHKAAPEVYRPDGGR